MKRIALFAFAAACLSGMISCQNGTGDSYAPYQIKKFENNPYLAEVWWGDDFDPETASRMQLDKYNRPDAGTGCTSWHKDNFHGRNIDWMMRDYATLIIHMPKTDKVKYASVGLIAGLPAADVNLIANNTEIPEEMRSWLPGSVVDGINECGVCLNHNIVPVCPGESFESNGDLSSMNIVRQVLDNCATAKEAVEFLQSKKVTQAVAAIAGDYSHFEISDPTCSYVVEWVNKEMIATEFKADGNGNYISASGRPAIMTNYFVAMAEKYGFKTNDFFKNHPYAEGVERAETVESLLPEAKSVEDHLNICKSVWFRRMYLGLTDWASENYGKYGYDEQTGKAWWRNVANPEEETHYMDNDDVYAAAMEIFRSGAMQKTYDEFKNGGDVISHDSPYWFTQHSVVYDIAAKKGYLIMQEGIVSDDVIEFGID